MERKKGTAPAWGRTGRRGAGVWMALLAFLLGALGAPTPVQGASGTVYSCIINRCYAHPVTGEIEDSGGEASYATGQGMVEGAVSSQGILEMTDSGEYYLTFRISLVDFTSGHSFSVQNTGESGWSAVTPSVTAKGSDSNGATSDLCIQVPSENCVVRGSMYVTPMGRDVVFYFYPNNYTEGNTTDMTAAMVTENAGGGTAAAPEAVEGGAAPSPEAEEPQPEGGSTASASRPAADEAGGEGAGESKNTKGKESGGNQQPASSISQEAAPQKSSSDTQLSSAQGLSLSTAPETEEEAGKNSGGSSLVGLAAALTVSLTISGLILMAAASVLVYYFRRNWRRWGGYDDEGYEEDEE